MLELPLCVGVSGVFKELAVMKGFGGWERCLFENRKIRDAGGWVHRVGDLFINQVYP